MTTFILWPFQLMKFQCEGIDDHIKKKALPKFKKYSNKLLAQGIKSLRMKEKKISKIAH